MIIFYLRRALKDIANHRFLNLVTITTIALSILIASAFVLFFVNANDMIKSWEKGMRIMVYLKPDAGEGTILQLRQRIESLPKVQTTTFLPKDEALARLKHQMRRQSSLFENLRENPLPDAFEVRIAPPYTAEDIEGIAKRIESYPAVDDVEYGQRWLEQFVNVMNMFRFAGYALIALFSIATLFMVANTVRLILYSRREEIEVMRLVGATDLFIKAPLYIQGLIQGALGAMGGLAMLFIAFSLITSNIGQGMTAGLSRVRFLSPFLFVVVVCWSMFVGWLGCFLSLKQFLRS
ncbi:MAG: ABC transporter permease [Deltaproteobacteria bacterium]|nr:ABC transporter permease [Deltaproteobacteria bacterium]MBW1993866.1 ABC transporter permease [Deltaproteobacteria bacterium]MBW2150146.1 ABC transporter permease [Deltaproteobacteria bacterium]